MLGFHALAIISFGWLLCKSLTFTKKTLLFLMMVNDQNASIYCPEVAEVRIVVDGGVCCLEIKEFKK